VRAVTSKCGVLAFYPDWKIRAGQLPETCWACRGGKQPAASPPSGHRTTDEKTAQLLQQFWESPIMGTVSAKIEEKTNLKGREAVREWNDLGRAFLEKIIGATPYGLLFGWKGHVRDCHYLPAKKGAEMARVAVADAANRRLTLHLHPKGGDYTFDVDLSTVRNDVQWPDLVRAVETACDPSKVLPAPVVTAAKPVATVATPSANGTHAPTSADIQALVDMRNVMDRVINAGGDLAEIERMKAEAQKKVDELREKHAAAYTAAVEKQEAVKATTIVFQQALEKANDLERRLRNAIVDRDEADKKLDAAVTAQKEAEAVVGPLASELNKAVDELKQAEQLEAERIAAIGKEDKVRVLMAALKNLS
jgi:DNA repair exonuclease SbcCD ATPase subunit